jgi:hypothetical protein
VPLKRLYAKEKLQKMTHNEVMRLLRYRHHLRGNPDRDAPFIFFHPKGSGWTRNLDASTARELIENKIVIEQTPEIYVLNQDSIDAREKTDKFLNSDTPDGCSRRM